MKRTPHKLPAIGGAGNSERTVDLAGLMVALLLAGVVLLVGVMPVLEQRQQWQSQRQRLLAKQQAAEASRQEVQALRTRLERTRQAVTNNPLRLDPLTALNERVSRITELATRSGLEIERIRPGRQVPGEHYHTVPIRLLGRGAFEKSTAFLHRLHRILPDVAVASFALRGRPDRANTDQPATFEFDLLWYAAPPTAHDES